MYLWFAQMYNANIFYWRLGCNHTQYVNSYTINLVVSLARPQGAHFEKQWSKQQPFLCFLYITTESWEPCVCP